MNSYLCFVVFASVMVGVISVSKTYPGTTTRYWDCCKPSCSWSGKASVNSPVMNCDKDGVTKLPNANGNSCDNSGGNPTPLVYTCTTSGPLAINNSVSVITVAAKIDGLTEAQTCCACFEVTLLSGPAQGKILLAQVTNTGSDLVTNQMDCNIPASGPGIYDACTTQWGQQYKSSWGATYGGISTKAQCTQIPSQLQPGCNWRFDWFMGSDNPSTSFRQVQCPPCLTKRTGCKRTDDSTQDPKWAGVTC